LHHLSKQLTLAARCLSLAVAFFWWCVRAPEYGPKLIKSGFSCAGATTLGEILASKQIGAHSFVLQMRAMLLLLRVFVLALLPLLSRRQITLSVSGCLYVVQL
jgi:hypothetical protein